MIDAIWKIPGWVLSPAGKKARLSILMYHQVLAADDPFRQGNVTAEQFDQQMSFVSKTYNVLPLKEAVGRLVNGTLPARSLAITFDDGYRDNLTIALPILRKYSLNATFFIATGFLNGGRMWNDTIIEVCRLTALDVIDLTSLGLPRYEIAKQADRLKLLKDMIGRLKYLELNQRLEYCQIIAEKASVDLPNDLMMYDEDVRELRRAGMLIGGHTARHPILSKISLDRSCEEISEGKNKIEEIIGESITLFAYPNGVPNRDYSAEHVSIMRQAGFEAAVTTSAGVSTMESDIYQLPRFTPWDKTPFRFSARLLTNNFTKAQKALA